MKLKILITGGNGNIAKMIKKNLSNNFDILNPSHKELDILNFEELKKYLTNNSFDILIHTAILGGRRTKTEEYDIVYNNLLMFENLMLFVDNFKMIINFDSAAIYDRKTDILNRKENGLLTVPTDLYGFSKYMIYQRSLLYKNVYNFRIFNIYHINEEETRFIKSCFNAKKNNTEITIFEDKYFDFVYELDFIKIIKYYLDNADIQNNLSKTINICYDEKYKLSEIAEMILGCKTNIKIINSEMKNNYSGDSSLLKTMNMELLGLDKSLKIYEDLYNKIL